MPDRAVHGELARQQRHVGVGDGVRVHVREEAGAQPLVLRLDEDAVHAVLHGLHHHYAEVQLALHTHHRAITSAAPPAEPRRRERTP